MTTLPYNIFWGAGKDLNLRTFKEQAHRQTALATCIPARAGGKGWIRTIEVKNNCLTLLALTTCIPTHVLFLMVRGVGADPTTLEGTVLQTAEFADSLYPPIYKAIVFTSSTY